MIRVKSTEVEVPAAKTIETRDLDIDLPNIRPDQSAQPRESLHNDRIAEYAESMKAGDQFPPLTVFHDGEVYWLADGFHRFYAAQHAGRKHIRCYVRQGGLRDAILYSVGANAKHGLARSDADKERAVLRLLNDVEWSTWTDRDIAKRCFVSHPFVAKVRKAHAGVTGNASSERTYTTKHGTTATMKTAGINASRATNFRAENVQVDAADHQKENAVEFVAAQGFDPADRPVAASAEFAQPRNIFDELVSLWKEADAGVRQDFKAYITGSAAVAKLNLRQESDPATTTGGHDVDRSAERASSAVEVGATNSPDGANEAEEVHLTGRGTRERGEHGANRRNGGAVERRISEGSPVGEAEDASVTSSGGENPASNSHSQPVASDQLAVATPADTAAAEDPQASRPSAAASPFVALSRVEQVKLLRPHCQHPATDLCGGSGRNHCHSCKKLMAESEAA